MSNLLNKVKSSMHRDRDTEPVYDNDTRDYDNPRSTNAGPHSSNAMNAADPRVDSDRGYNTNAGGYGGSPTTGTGAGYNTGATNDGPHNSNLMNKTDPRVDSDRDNRNNPASHAGGYGQTQGYGSNAGPNTTGYNNGSATTGPHNSNLANKVDPRVDSDNSNARKPVAGGNTSSLNRDATRDSGYAQSHSPTGTGPHKSNLANKLDPRVDTTDDHTTHSTGRGTMEHDTQHSGPGIGSSNIQNTTGTANDKMTHNTKHEGGGTYDSSAQYRQGAGHVDTSRTHHSGPGIHESSTTQGHSGTGNTTSTTHTSTHMTSNAAGRDGYDNRGVNPGMQSNQGYENRPSALTPGSSKGQNTAGPHNSNLANKLDPRVDSDMSKVDNEQRRRAY